SKRVGFFHVSHFSIYLVNALVFNGKAVVKRRGFRPKIFDDWPILATALLFNCPIWTEDQDFFGTGVPTWTLDRVHLYFHSEEKN
ncbi:MAG: hypothetical protein EWV91_10405, partial [Microcystis aeruginosa Ma_QC_Ca_00000000_S207]